jgi:nucleotide-binding universal stress UspA family protein
MGASGRSALARVVTGSVALRVAAKSRRPLVLVRKPRRR